jgi:hypothetical protein
MITSPGLLVSVPGNFQSTTGTSSTPFWNNNSVDGINMNVGDFLTGSNPSLGSTNYLGASPTYLSTGGGGPDAPNFTFLQSALTLQGMLLFSDSPANYNHPGTSGTSIGLYDVADPNQKETLFAAGTLYNPANPNGVFNNNVTPQSPVSLGSWANYGVYAYTCGLSSPGNVYCNMYYSDATLNHSTDPNHQHFALFEDPKSPNTYYIGFEDNRGINATEGYGDYNDVIFKLQTSQIQTFNTTDVVSPTVTPEPATFSILGLGLLGLGLLRRGSSRIGG